MAAPDATPAAAAAVPATETPAAPAAAAAAATTEATPAKTPATETPAAPAAAAATTTGATPAKTPAAETPAAAAAAATTTEAAPAETVTPEQGEGAGSVAIAVDDEEARRAQYDRDTLYLEEHMPDRLDLSTTAYGQENINENHPSLVIDEVAFTDPELVAANSVFDSTYGSDGSINTASISSSIFHYQYENGRRYHAFREGQYMLPNDDREQERLTLQHHIWRLLLHGQLYIAPIEDKENMRILDLGCGTGIWAIEMADEFPSAEVCGIDLSPIQPDWVPPNCRFHVDDFEDEWTYREDEKFDYIHGRSLSGTCADYSVFYSKIMKHLKPGGWCEIQEYDAWVFSDDDSCDKARWTMEWVEKLDVASRKFGRTMNVARFHKQWMIEAGFEDVHEEVVRIPIGPWAKDPHLKELGRFEQVHMQMSVESHTLALFTRIWGYTEEQARLLIEGVKRDFRNKDLHLITSYRFIRGRKPENAV